MSLGAKQELGGGLLASEIPEGQLALSRGDELEWSARAVKVTGPVPAWLDTAKTLWLDTSNSRLRGSRPVFRVSPATSTRRALDIERGRRAAELLGGEFRRNVEPGHGDDRGAAELPIDTDLGRLLDDLLGGSCPPCLCSRRNLAQPHQLRLELAVLLGMIGCLAPGPLGHGPGFSRLALIDS